MKTLILVSVALLMLAACGSKDAQYYAAHPEEMKAKMEVCSRMSEVEKMADKECAAVSQANVKRALDLDPPKTSPLAGPGKGKGFKNF